MKNSISSSPMITIEQYRTLRRLVRDELVVAENTWDRGLVDDRKWIQELIDLRDAVDFE